MEKNIEKLRDAMAELDGLKNKKEEIKKKALEHRDRITDAEIDAKKAEVRSINEKIEKKQKEVLELQERAIEENKKEDRSKKNMDLEKNKINETREKVLSKFKTEKRISIKPSEVRSTLLASGGIVKPTRVGGITDPFNTQLTILDQVRVDDMTGAGTYKESLLKTYSTASERTDGVAQAESDPVFGSVTITPQLIAVTSYVSKELEKTTPLNYLSKVQESALVALKVKLAQDIVSKIKVAQDDAGADLFQTLEASATNGMLSGGSGAINEKTLRNIVMNYGGDANVMGNAVLYLNKADLIAFGDVRGTNEKKAVYEITPNADNPNIGTIKDGGLTVPYCIIPTLTPLAGTAQTTSAIQTMIYGSPLNYKLSLFGDYTVEASRDENFSKGLISILGEVMVGGNVVAYNGFEIVTIPASE